MRYEECREKLMRLLAVEYNCAPDDLAKSENIITSPALNEGRRMYSREAPFFAMATMGGNAVITADERLHSFLREYTAGKPGHYLFELQNLMPVERELNRYGYTLTGTFQMFLPFEPKNIGCTFETRWFCDEEIHSFYGDERFPNAICEKFLPGRPDRIVVCAYDGERIMGMAGCSEDAPGWMQIGIDVMPEYRSRGVGTALVNILKNRIAEQGDIPFYGTSAANYNSWNIAINCGFRPAWVEVGSKRA